MKKTLNRIAVNKEAFLYLDSLMRKERGCKPLNDQAKDMFWKRVMQCSASRTPEGLKILDDESMGGGDGTYYGKWTNWTCEDLKKLLAEAGHEWKELGSIEVEYINV